jgi:hypothetical protein
MKSDWSFLLIVVVLMLLFWGEPDLFDAIRVYLIRLLQ